VSVTAIAHPNIALIKYWGKQAGDGNLPATPSVSITLDDLASTTLIASSPDDGDHIVLNGERAIDPKISACLTMLRADFEIPPVSIDSTNNFPTAAGLASSASGFAALITAIDAFCGLGLGDDDRAVYARRASGSAARSIYGGFASLGPPDWIARPVLPANEWPLKVVIAITDEGRKSVSSSVGMKTSEETSPYYGPWVSSTAEDYEAALAAVAARNFERLADLSESSCLKMHGVMQSSRPPMIYWRPATLSCIHTIREMRAGGLPVFFTIDAGPQVKAVCLPEAVDSVEQGLASIPGVLDIRTVGLGAGARLLET
jgi:diphosphomevalonate decarboxylase